MAVSTKQVVATVPVYDYELASGDPTLINPPGLNGKRVKVTLAYDKARSTAPVTWASSQTVYATLTDPNGFWQVNVQPTDSITPSGTYYIVEVEGVRSFKINPTLAGVPGIGWQSSAILLDIPASLTPAGQTVGPLTVTGLLTASGGIAVTGLLAIGPGEPGLDTSSPGALLIGDNVATSIEMGSGATPFALQGDIATRSITLLASGPYVASSDPGSINNEYWCPPPSGSAATDTANIGAQITAALAAGAGRVWLQRTKPGSPYLLNAVLPTINKVGVSLCGPGSGACMIQPTAAVTGDCLKWTLTGAFVVTQAGTMSGFTLDGTNAGSAAVGIHAGDITGCNFDDLVIQNFTGSTAVGIKLDNVTNWMERTTFWRVHLNNNNIGLQFNDSGGAGSISYAYLRMLDLRMNVNPNQTGIQVAGTSFIYSGLLFFHANVNGNGIVWSSVGTSQTINSLFWVAAEQAGATTGTLFNVGAGARVAGHGHISNYGGAGGVGTPMLLTNANAASQGGSLRIVPIGAQATNWQGVQDAGAIANFMGSGNAATVLPTIFNSESLLLGSLGMLYGTNIDSAYASFYNSGGNGFFLYRIPFATALNAGTLVFNIDSNGHIVSAITGTPTTSNLGANVTSATVTGNDTRGKIVIVMSAGLAANTRICTVTYVGGGVWQNNVTPFPLVANQTSGVGLAAVNFYTGAETGAVFDLFSNQALVVGTYMVRYAIIG